MGSDDNDDERPTLWRQRSSANHPVVYILWYEAQAYCEWLTGKLQSFDGLPERHGGAFYYYQGGVRCACRYGDDPDLRLGGFGFRVVLLP